MFILNEGRDAFNKFMTTALAQIVYGGIAILVLYRATQLPLEFNTLVFYIFLILLWTLFALWIVSGYKDFIFSFQSFLKLRFPNINKAAKDLTVMDIWSEDRKIAFEYGLNIVLLIGLLIFVFFGSYLSAMQIAETIKLQ
ncbi:hypothetical protein [Acinetobacter indicus]|uniref:DUF3899 domain-containing protein n=1 Tax=Acinetobacter indicus TaxID=756892 RepID=A0A6C0Y190_9GAMM|nr:hypothetical protein [Acinetobacter indicus]QIC69790.1 hypothetical protein FSC09_04925 [Acinetobacter indicus]